MLFELLVTADAAEVRDKVETGACLALEGRYRAMLVVAMLANARCPPSVYIKPLAPRHPPLAQFFRPSGYESKKLAGAATTVGLCLAFGEHFAVRLEQVAAEALAFCTDAEAIFFGLWADPGHINAALNCLFSMLELPGQHLLCTRGRPNL